MTVKKRKPRKYKMNKETYASRFANLKRGEKAQLPMGEYDIPTIRSEASRVGWLYDMSFSVMARKGMEFIIVTRLK